MDQGDFTFLASLPSGRARGRARTKMVGPMAYTLSIASAATAYDDGILMWQSSAVLGTAKSFGLAA